MDTAPVTATPSGPVLDADAALHIGLPVIEQRFGQTVFEKHQPYEATLHRGQWVVVGNLDPDGRFARLREDAGPDTLVSIRGGAPTAVISAENGRVLSVVHGR